MPTIVTRHLRTAGRRDGDPLNVLLYGVSHERYLSLLARTGDRFFVLQGEGLKGWDGAFAAPPPDFLFCDASRPLPPDLPIDLVMSESRASQFARVDAVARAFQVPHLTLEHVQPPPSWGDPQLAPYRAMRGDVDVFISGFSRAAWGFAGTDARVIEHAIDPAFTPPDPSAGRSPVALSVVNQWQRRDAECGFSFWVEAMRGLPVAVLGDNPGLSRKAEGLAELAAAYRGSLLFVNTSQVSPIPMTLLEAAACGCCVVSTRNPMIESVFEDGLNGRLVDDPQQMRTAVEYLLKYPEIAGGMGARAAADVAARFGLDRFVADWRRALRDAADSDPVARRGRGGQP
jgi:hypothetical protein